MHFSKTNDYIQNLKCSGGIVHIQNYLMLIWSEKKNEFIILFNWHVEKLTILKEQETCSIEHTFLQSTVQEYQLLTLLVVICK